MRRGRGRLRWAMHIKWSEWLSYVRFRRVWVVYVPHFVRLAQFPLEPVILGAGQSFSFTVTVRGNWSGADA